MKYFNLFSIVLVASLIVSGLLHEDKFPMDIQGIHTWRQSLTMINVRNFIHHDQNILNPASCSLSEGQPRVVRLEFPLLQWTIARLQMYIGEHIAVARGFMFFVGAWCLLGMYFVLKDVFENELVALVGSLLFQFSALFYYYTVNPFSDLLALLFALWYLHFSFMFMRGKGLLSLLASACFLSLATLVKLPFLMVSVVGIIYFFQTIGKKEERGNLALYAAAHLALLVPAFAWYAWVIPDWEGGKITAGIFAGSMTLSELKTYLWYNLKFVIPEQLLSFASLPLFVLGLVVARNRKIREELPLLPYAWSLLGISMVYFLLQISNIGTAHDYYLMPLFPGFYLFVGLGAYYFRQNYWKAAKWVLPFLVILSVVLSYKTATPRWKPVYSYFNLDVINNQEALSAAVPDNEPVIMLNDHTVAIFANAIRKNGYIFWGDGLRPLWIEDLVGNKHVKYMYCDAPSFAAQPEVARFIDSTLLRVGTVGVYRLSLPDH